MLRSVRDRGGVARPLGGCVPLVQRLCQQLVTAMLQCTTCCIACPPPSATTRPMHAAPPNAHIPLPVALPCPCSISCCQTYVTRLASAMRLGLPVLLRWPPTLAAPHGVVAAAGRHRPPSLDTKPPRWARGAADKPLQQGGKVGMGGSHQAASRGRAQRRGGGKRSCTLTAQQC